MGSENEPANTNPRPPADQRGTDGEDLVLPALNFLRGSLSANVGACGPPTLTRQKEDLRQWADGLGLLLSPSDLPAKVIRGGQEHELFHDESTDRYFKVTRNGVFGLSPGIELVLIPFDVIPCHPAGGFLAFIEETLTAGHSIRAIRTVTTKAESSP